MSKDEFTLEFVILVLCITGLIVFYTCKFYNEKYQIKITRVNNLDKIVGCEAHYLFNIDSFTEQMIMSLLIINKNEIISSDLSINLINRMFF